MTALSSYVSNIFPRWQTHFLSSFGDRSRSLGRGLLLAGLSSLGAIAIAPTSYAAERIYVAYNILERSISVKALEDYAQRGVMDEDLAVYAQYADPKVLENLRTALQAKADVNPVTVAQFLYSPQGEVALKRLGQVIRPESRISGYQAIRAALILAARDPEGLTLLNFLRRFPARGIRIDVERSLKVVREAEQLINKTKQATQVIIQVASEEQVTTPPPSSNLMDLRRSGPFRFQKQTITLNDPDRGIATPSTPALPASARDLLKGRIYKVDIYTPLLEKAAAPRSLPVVVISHGLGSDRDSFAYLASHLASHGFVVLVPEHPGSDSKYMEALLQGNASEVSEPGEFANRPLDITYLLNYLEEQSRTNPTYQSFNLQQVGVIGQSFGGYTALALAGAAINFPELQASCTNLENTFNISLLLQCRALQLQHSGQTRSDFRDPRIQAAIALNPITSAVLGKTSLSAIQIPTMIVAGSSDTVTPALFEQVQPFTWLTTLDKYLVQIDPGTHFSVIGDVPAPNNSSNNSKPASSPNSSTTSLNIPPEVIGPDPAAAQRYTKALTLAFFKTYIAQHPSFRAYLSASYAQSISQADLRVDLVRTLPADQLSQGSIRTVAAGGEVKR
ncbi:alpha/beta hydrolase [Leptodesmis sp.]|uniref:alpha/beta hydrolase n=1 Tax=Leptodesmis sp. TaxID=3100501 RepID=UPI00405346C4